MPGETVQIIVSSKAIHQVFYSLRHSVELGGAGVKDGSAVSVELGVAMGGEYGVNVELDCVTGVGDGVIGWVTLMWRK